MVVSIQWHRIPLGRLLVPGIAVKRAKDRGAICVYLRNLC